MKFSTSLLLTTLLSSVLATSELRFEKRSIQEVESRELNVANEELKLAERNLVEAVKQVEDFENLEKRLAFEARACDAKKAKKSKHRHRRESEKKKKPKPKPGHNSGGTSGEATWFTQDGTTGACGKKVSDSSRVVALSAGTYRQNCYKTVTITNLKTGKTIEASVNDECPECASNHLDLSLGAWDALGSSRGTGVIPIKFHIN